MWLKDLFEALPGAVVEGPLDREVTGVAYDSRRVTPGMVFVAVPGLHVDGHEYVHTAVDRGAVAVICERIRGLPTRATRVKVADTREALACLARAFYQNPSARLKVIGVTGTNGKTTVAFMVKAILEAAGIKTGLLGCDTEFHENQADAVQGVVENRRHQPHLAHAKQRMGVNLHHPVVNLGPEQHQPGVKNVDEEEEQNADAGHAVQDPRPLPGSTAIHSRATPPRLRRSPLARPEVPNIRDGTGRRRCVGAYAHRGQKPHPSRLPAAWQPPGAWLLPPALWQWGRLL